MSLYYFDSSALVKLVAHEPESAALFSLLEPLPEVVSSALARVEVLRAVARAGGIQADRRRALDLMDRVTLVAADEMVLRSAAAIEPVELRSLDAVHLATAQSLAADLTAFVGYDRRLNRAAEGLGLTVLAPG